MKGNIKNRTITLTILFALGCFAACPRLFALVPSPGGGYPRANTAEENGALHSLQPDNHRPAHGNTALDFQTLYSLTAGAGNTAIGLDALFENVSRKFNTATGVNVLFHNTADYLKL